MWLLLSILLVAGELPTASQFPAIERNLPKAVRYTSLWETKDATRIREIKVFWAFIEENLRTWINRRLHFSSTIYNSLQSAAEFKADMHNMYIRARKDPTQKWVKLPFIATNDAIFEVMASWSPEWRALDLEELENLTAQQKKRETKLRIAKLTESKHQEQEAAMQQKVLRQPP